MLPLVPLHQMVPPQGAFDSDPSFRHSFSYQNQNARLSEHGFPSPHRAFPIRASQPPRPSHLRGLDYRENYLRRKTPNGILDASYDGTHAHFASGPPPLKHMILSGAASLSSTPAATADYEYIISGQQAWPSRPSVTVDHSEPRDFNSYDVNHFTYGLSWQQGLNRGSRPVVALDCAPNHPSTAYYPYNNALRVPTVNQPNYQQSPGPTIFNNGGQAPPPAWPEMNAQGLEPTAFGIPSYQTLNMQSPYPQTPLAPRSSRIFQYDNMRGNLQVPAQRLESLTLDPGGYSHSGTHLSDMPSPARFREKALTNAHRAYVDLLAFLHSSKRSVSSRSSGGSRSSSKMIIYPKVPNQTRQLSSTYGRRHSLGFGNAAAQPGPLRSHLPGGHRDAREMSTMSPGVDHMSRVVGFANNEHYSQYHDTYHHHASGMPRQMATTSPMQNARSAVHMLQHLCEQSDWKWADGMLLGGCLYYGLEKYEEALEWFTRVLFIDNK